MRQPWVSHSDSGLLATFSFTCFIVLNIFSIFEPILVPTSLLFTGPLTPVLQGRFFLLSFSGPFLLSQKYSLSDPSLGSTNNLLSIVVVSHWRDSQVQVPLVTLPIKESVRRENLETNSKFSKKYIYVKNPFPWKGKKRRWRPSLFERRPHFTWVWRDHGCI